MVAVRATIEAHGRTPQYPGSAVRSRRAAPLRPPRAPRPAAPNPLPDPDRHPPLDQEQGPDVPRGEGRSGQAEDQEDRKPGPGDPAAEMPRERQVRRGSLSPADRWVIDTDQVGVARSEELDE